MAVIVVKITKKCESIKMSIKYTVNNAALIWNTSLHGLQLDMKKFQTIHVNLKTDLGL